VFAFAIDNHYHLGMNTDCPIYMPKQQLMHLLCACTDSDCTCMVLHYRFFDEHNRLMRAWFTIQKHTLTHLLAASHNDQVDLTHDITPIAVLPDECSDDIAGLLGLHGQSDQPVTLH